MAELAELERAKRRRLQEAYADLRPGGPASQRNDERQTKLRNLLQLGAAANAGLPTGSFTGSPSRREGAGGGGGGAAGSRGVSGSGSGPQAVRALAAAAAATIQAVSGSPGGSQGGPLPPRRTALHSAASLAASPALSAGGPRSPPVRASSAPSPIARTAAGLGCGGGVRATTAVGATAAAAAGVSGRRTAPPPPGPLEGGFLPEVDPVQRLSRLPQAALLAAVGGGCSGGGGAGAGGVGSASASGNGLGGPGEGLMQPRGGGGAGGGGGWRTAAQAQAEEDEDDEDVEVPSDVELALISLKSDLRAHPGSADLPPLALRSQLSCMLTDRSTVERQLDEQRRANRVRLFKLPTGPDEVGILTTSDYRTIVLQAADDAAAAAAAAAATSEWNAAAGASTTGDRRAASAPVPLSGGQSYVGAYGDVASAYGHIRPDAGAGAGAASRCAVGPPRSRGSRGHSTSSSKWHVAADLFLRRVVDRFTDFQLSHVHLVHLLGQQQPGRGLGRHWEQQQQGQGQGQGQGQQEQQQGTGQQRQRHLAGYQQGQQQGANLAAGPGIGGMSAEQVEEQVSLLLHLGAIARHTDGDADAYVLAVPGAGKLVKSVLGGRKELLTWLSKRQYLEAPEEQACKLKLRISCLPPSFHVRDLVGRGAVQRLISTCGPMLRLPGGGPAGGKKRKQEPQG